MDLVNLDGVLVDIENGRLYITTKYQNFYSCKVRKTDLFFGSERLFEVGFTTGQCGYCVFKKIGRGRWVYDAQFGSSNKALDIDHIDGDRSNDKIGNLRLVTQSQNSINRKGYGKDTRVGICRNRSGINPWRAYLLHKGKPVLNKVFKTREEAIKAREQAELLHFGFIVTR